MKKFAKPMLSLVLCSWAMAQSNSYVTTYLVSDLQGVGVTKDPHLVNPWGLSKIASPTPTENEWWVSDQVTGVSTLYDADGTFKPLVVTIPPAGGTGVGSPTGTVAIGTTFYFATLDGTISRWLATTGPPLTSDPHITASVCSNCHTTTATIGVNRSSAGASYSGLAAAVHAGRPTLYATNGAGAGSVEVYDAANFSSVSLPAGAFTDATVPTGYVPNGIQAIGNVIYVAFAPNSNAAVGAVDAFDNNGKLLLRLQNGVWFNQPWGIALAPSNFGLFSNAILVSNTGSGTIAAFSPASGSFLGVLRNASNGQPVALPGLWGISFGNGNVQSGPVNTLYFATGLKNTVHGIFGAITAN